MRGIDTIKILIYYNRKRGMIYYNKKKGIYIENIYYDKILKNSNIGTSVSIYIEKYNN